MDISNRTAIEAITARLRGEFYVGQKVRLRRNPSHTEGVVQQIMSDGSVSVRYIYKDSSGPYDGMFSPREVEADYDR